MRSVIAHIALTILALIAFFSLPIWIAASMVSEVTGDLKVVSQQQREVVEVLNNGFEAYQESMQEFVDDIGMLDDYTIANYKRLEEMQRLWHAQFPQSVEKFKQKILDQNAVRLMEDMTTRMESLNERIDEMEGYGSQ